MTDARQGSDFVVVANRLPVDLERLPDGSKRWKRSPGGLVTALEPILRSNNGAWVGWPGVTDDDVEPFVEDELRLHPVKLSAQDIADYYEGFSNGTLWPLYHDVIVKPVYDRAWWNSYVDVNRRFAETTSLAAAQGATVWIQDYQLQLVPKMLRMLRPDLVIGFFMHIPFPPVELFMQMPWRTEIIEGLLGADLIGFHLPGGAQNFLYLARRLAGQPTSRGSVGVRSKLGVVQVGFSHSSRGRLPDFHRLGGTGREVSLQSGPRPREGATQRARESEEDHARNRQTRLHQRNRCAPQRISRTARRKSRRSSGHSHHPARHPQPRARRQLRADAR